ncbi:MAG: NADH-quinone oxidoreductase subunit NuoE [Pseudomonadota bacterium]
MSTRRLHSTQPESFAFTPENMAWAEGQIGKFPPGRQASAVIPLLFRAQEQEGWLSRPAIEEVARLLEMPFIRALEVATFYFMFRLAPIGSVAHVEVCGTTPCMLCGAEDLVAVCKEKIAPSPHTLSADGRFSWEEVECLGACSNAPMVQIFKDYYEDLTAESFAKLLDDLAAWGRGEGAKPPPGSRKGRFASEPLGGVTTLTEIGGEEPFNASVSIATGHEPEPRMISGGVAAAGGAAAVLERETGLAPGEAPAPIEDQPTILAPPADGGDDLKRINGVGPQLEGMLRGLGFHTFDQIASWTPQNVAWVDQRLEGFRGRILRDDWVGQARVLLEQKRNGG